MRKSTILAAGPALLLGFPAFAQQLPRSLSSISTDTIIVTARKTAEPLLKSPQSISAITAGDIRENGLRSVYDAQYLIPNFTLEKSAGRRSDRPVIRGMSNIAADSNASFYVDGVFVVGSISSTTLDAVERIEVVRGPQSAMFGPASFAGAINYVTRSPTDTWQGQVDSRLGTSESYRLSGWVSGPILPGRVQMFLSGGVDNQGGQYRNHNSGTAADANFPGAPTRADNSRLGSERSSDVTGKLRVLLSDNLTLNLKSSYLYADDSHIAGVLIRGNEQNCFKPVAGTSTAKSRGYYCGEASVGGRQPAFNIPDFEDGLTSRFGTAAPAEPGIRRSVWRNAADLQATVNGWHLFAQAAQDNDFTEAVTDSDFTTLRPSFGGLQYYTQDDRHSHSYEVRASSPEQHPLQLLVGGYYFKSDVVSRLRSFAVTIPLTEFSTNITENRALFGRLQWSVTPALRIAAEGRVARERRIVTGSSSRAASADFDSFTPRISVDYQINPDQMLYAIVARGNKPGGFNTAAYSRSLANDATFVTLKAQGLDRVAEEKQMTYEVGTKGRYLDGRLTLSADAFFVDWSNQALTRTVDVVSSAGIAGVASVLVNAGKTHVYGTELEANFQITPHLDLFAAYGWAHARLRAYNDDEIAILTGITDPLLVNGGNARGKALPFAPEHTFSLGANWRHPLSAGTDAYVSTNARYESRKYSDVTNYQWLGDVILWNIRAGITKGPWTIGSYVNNLLDDRTPTGDIRSSDPTVAAYATGSPRSFQLALRRGREAGLTASYRF